MAAHSNTSIRVRLLFDYPPPAVVDCRMCWLLVDLNACRVVADLESVIREKFDFGRGSILSLFVEGCYLPHTESVYVVRDNDSVRVKVDCLARVNGHSSSPDTFSGNVKKRRRDAEEDGLGENTVMKKKKKKKSVETAVRDTVQASGDETHKEPVAKKKKKKKKKKKQKKVEEKGPPVVPKPAATPKKTPVKVPKTPPVARSKPQKASSSDASSSSSEEDKAPRKPAPQKAAPKAPTSAPAASRAPPTTKPTQTKSRPPSSSSSETSDDEAAVVKSTPKPPSITLKGGVNPKAQQASPAQRPADGEQRQAARVAPPPGDDSDSEEEIKLVIRQPAQQPVLGLGARQSPWRGRGHGGRGEGRGGLGEGRGGRGEGRGGRGEGRGGRGEGRGGRGEEVGRGAGRGAARGHGASFGFRYEGAEEPSCRSDQLTNLSAIIQNGAERAPKKDYSCMPLLAAPPQVGQKIAFKLLELTENYTPEVSQYKEGRIVTFDLTTKQIELQLLNGFQAPVEPGKFDLVYQNPDGSESVEYAVVRGSRVTERWDSLLEPRLII
uniref:Coilin p80 n=1 Tax=Gasterosteus aculeatus aculeatus TaxID=481459 RepID=A0AAQ4QXU3_GASAC|nr:coilin [Gasterosteus aculeatus aculeatus]